MEELTILC